MYGHYIPYNKEEDEIILHYMRGVDLWDGITIRCNWIHKHHLPHRTPGAIRGRFDALRGKTWRRSLEMNGRKAWQNDIKDVADLLSPEQRKRFKVRLPTFKNYIDPRTGRRV